MVACTTQHRRSKSWQAAALTDRPWQARGSLEGKYLSWQQLQQRHGSCGQSSHHTRLYKSNSKSGQTWSNKVKLSLFVSFGIGMQLMDASFTIDRDTNGQVCIILRQGLNSDH